MDLARFVRDLAACHDGLLDVPCAPVELTHLCVLPALNGLGRVVSPLGARATDVTLESTPLKYCRRDDDAILVSLRIRADSAYDADEQLLVAAHLSQLCQADVSYRISDDQHPRTIHAVARPAAGPCVDVTIHMPADAPAGAKLTLQSLRIAGNIMVALAPPPSIVVYDGPADLTSEQVLLLQTWLGGDSLAASWHEIYRATRDGFDAETFHTRCDNTPHLLALVREKKEGWLFGGYTSVGWLTERRGGGAPRYPDPEAFLFTLSNPADHPEKLASQGTGKEMTYQDAYLATFGVGADMLISRDADVNSGSWTRPSLAGVFSTPTPTLPGRPYPMCRERCDFCISELVVFAVHPPLAEKRVAAVA